MAAFDFSLWLANINLKDNEREEAERFIREAQFTYDDLANCDLDFAKQFFSKETLPSFCIAALFRIQKAISDLKKIERPPQQQPPQQQEAPIEASAVISAPVVEQQVPPSVDAVPDPPASQPAPSEPAMDDESSEADLSRWSTSHIVHWLRTCPEMVKIKKGTLDKIIDLCERLALTGEHLLEGDISKKYKDEFKEISLGGKHKLRKAIKALIASQGQAQGQVPPSDPANAPPASIPQPPHQPLPPSHPQPKPKPEPVQELPPASFAQPDAHQSPILSPPIAQPAPPSVHPSGSVYSPVEEEKQAIGQGFFNPDPNSAPAIASPVQPAPMLQPSVSHMASHPAPMVSVAMKSHKRTWYWYNDDGSWYPYEDVTSDQIEAAYNGSEESVFLTAGPFFESRSGQYGIKFDRKAKVHAQINYQSREERPVVSDDHESLREMACAAQPLTSSAPVPATVPILPAHHYPQNANGFPPSGYGQFQVMPHGANGYYPQQQPFGGGMQQYQDSSFQAPGGN